MNTKPQSHPLIHWLRHLLAIPVVLYALAIVAWAIAHRAIGDGYWLLALVNAFSIYLFLPLPAMGLLSLLARRRAAWLSLGVAGVLFLSQFGGILIPPIPTVHASNEDTTLTAMTYNVLYTTDDPAPIVDTIAQAEPDVIAFQELSYLRAQAVAEHIGTQYPHRTPMQAEHCHAQTAIWSRYPIVAIETVDPEVQCRISAVVIDFNGQHIRVVNLHAWPFVGVAREQIEQSFGWRQEQITWTLKRFGGQPEPMILLGDLNSTSASEVYRQLDAQYENAFTVAGWGLGHTYPSQPSQLWDLSYPARLVRIDHIFYSDAWRAESAWVAEPDGTSDHLAVVARLVLIR